MATAETSDAEIDAYFSADPESIAWPYPMLDRWRAGTGVVEWKSGPAVILTKYKDVQAAMAGKLPLKQNAYRYGRLADGQMLRLPEKFRDVFLRVVDFESLFMSRHDGDEHRRLRKISSRAFTARRVEQLRGMIQQHTDDLFDEMLASPNPDYKVQFANQLPNRVITDMIGIPIEDRPLIWRWSEAIANVFSVKEKTVHEADVALKEFRVYVHDMVERLRVTGEGPELAMLLLSGNKDEVLTEDELVAMYLLILFGGSETTTNLLGNGFYSLQTHRDSWDRLVADPSLVRGAVDEMLRYDTPHFYVPRYAYEDFEIGGVQVKANDTVIVMHGAANRDEDVFADPNTFDITRSNKNEHLSFAFGAHFCLGASLARLEGEIVFDTFVKRFPNARLLDDKVAYEGSAMLRSIQHLPIELGEPLEAVA